MDVWLLFGLTLPFISFVLSILEELTQESKDDEMKVDIDKLISLLNFWQVSLLDLDRLNDSEESWK